MGAEVYSVISDTLNSVIHEVNFQDEVLENGALAAKFDYFQVIGDVITLFFTPDLTSGERTSLTTIVNNHDGVGPSPSIILSVEPEMRTKVISSPTASEDVTLFYTTDNMRITKMVATLVGSGSPSVTWTIRFASDRSAAGTEIVSGGTTTTNTTTGEAITSFTNPNVPENSFVWLETSATGGTVDEFSICIVP